MPYSADGVAAANEAEKKRKEAEQKKRDEAAQGRMNQTPGGGGRKSNHSKSKHVKSKRRINRKIKSRRH